MESFLFAWLGGSDWLIASLQVGVGNNTPCDDEDAVSSVGGSNGTSWNKHRLDFVSVTLKVVADALQGKGLDKSVSSYSLALVE